MGERCGEIHISSRSPKSPSQRLEELAQVQRELGRSQKGIVLSLAKALLVHRLRMTDEAVRILYKSSQAAAAVNENARVVIRRS